MRFTAKRLTRSDLTLFEVQLHLQNAGQQKAINLNRNVFVDILYPGAPLLAGGNAARFPVDLRIYGPGGVADEHRLTRKIIAAGGTQKNWRLNGETIHNPRGTGRYDDLAEGDFAIMGFEGVPAPVAMVIILVTARAEADAAVHAELTRTPGLGGARGMVALTEADLSRLAALAPPGHPVADLLDRVADDELEEAALGSAEAVRRLRRRTVRRQTAEDLARARERALRTGRDGEVLVAAYLRYWQKMDGIRDFVWEADLNAVSPYDFTLVRNDGSVRRCEVKSTKGTHEHVMHVSQAQIEAAVEPNAPAMEIWRVSEMTEEGAVVRRSTNFGGLAARIMELASTCPDGVTPDNWTVRPALLDWRDPVVLRHADDPED